MQFAKQPLHPDAGNLEQMEAHFDVWAGRLLEQIPPPELAAVADALGHITADILADMEYMKGRK